MIEPSDAREEALLSLAHAYGTTVHIAPLGDGERGRYEAQTGRIFLKPGLTTAQRVSTLAHEIVHARRGDQGPQSPEVEAHVQEEAARLVVTASAYADAEAVAGPHPGALARELDVSPSLVVAWQRAAHRAALRSASRAEL